MKNVRFAFVAALLAGAAAVGLAACGSSPHNLNPTEAQTAELGGVRFSQAIGADFVGCSGIDSEPDGYVTCTAKDRETKKLATLTCSYLSNAAGCKAK